jgi:phosphatidylinositol alpha-mannosyltransferase
LDKFRSGERLAKYDDGKVNIVFLGRLEERKGCQHLLRSLAAIPQQELKNVRVLIAGSGKMKKKLEAQAWNSKLDNVKFLGKIPEKSKPDLLASADIAVFPASGGESFGIVLIEAMAARAGVVLAGNNTGYRSVLGATPNALFDPTDTDEFVYKLRTYIGSQRRRDRLHAEQQKHVEQFGISVVGPRILEVYRRAIAARKRAA